MGICQGTYGSFYEPQPVGVENVVIFLDTAKDEVELPKKYKSYAPAQPPMRQDIKPPVEWLDDDDDEYRPEEDVFGSRTSLLELEKRLAGAEHVTEAALNRIDTHAKMATRKDAGSFQSLLEYLSQPIKNEKTRELFMVRAITVWLASQDVENTKGFGPATTNTPNGYLQMQKELRATYASFFAALCRQANIQCTLIHGLCKAGDYQPGDTVLEECMWVSVRIQGNWQIIHPYWVSRSMIGHSTGGWIKLESDGKTISKSESSAQGKIMSAFKETYFLPKPDDFKYVCYPDEDEWQLLPEGRRLKNKQEFLKLPFLLPAFFGLGLNLLSFHCSELETKTGYIDIVIQGRKSHAFKMVMTYDLFLKETNESVEDNDMLRSGNLPRLVLNARCEEKFSFQIRFPVEGTYKIVFFAGFYGKPLLRVCEFKLSCLTRLPNCQLLPINTGIDGWGPGPKCERAGLLLASHQSGVISLQAPPDHNHRGKPDEIDNVANIKFCLDQEKMTTMEYSAEMVSGEDAQQTNSPSNQDLAKNVKCKVNEQTQELDVQATVDRAGEYALIIKAGKKGQKRRSVCNYLLSTLQGIREGVPQRKARKALKRALSQDSNLDEMADLIEKCRKAKIDDNDDDVKAGKKRQTFMLVKQLLKTDGCLKQAEDLTDCVKRRNLDVTNRSLAEVSKYRHKLALMIETRRVEKLKLQLEKLGGFTREVPQLNKACEELVYLKTPKPEVQCTMKTLFMLLEEPNEHRLDEWAHIQSLLKQSKEHNSNVLNRMKKISERELDARVRRKIHSHLHQYTEAQVRHSSQAAASFYIWIDGVLRAFGETGIAQQSDFQKEQA